MQVLIAAAPKSHHIKITRIEKSGVGEKSRGEEKCITHREGVKKLICHYLKKTLL